MSVLIVILNKDFDLIESANMDDFGISSRIIEKITTKEELDILFEEIELATFQKHYLIQFTCTVKKGRQNFIENVKKSTFFYELKKYADFRQEKYIYFINLNEFPDFLTKGKTKNELEYYVDEKNFVFFTRLLEYILKTEGIIKDITLIYTNV